ncbi:MAG: HAMP domain-containing protein [Rhodanobacteraceae bacterium]|nr:HAMP domain-containing protein [Rhodanobacteraceae bacterium]
MKRRSLFAHALWTVFAGMLLALGCAAWLAYALAFQPLAERSADDFAALLLLSGERYAGLPAAERGGFAASVWQQEQVRITAVSVPRDDQVRHHPYLNLLREALRRRTGAAARVRVSETLPQRFHAEIRYDAQWLRFDFGKARVPQRPRRALLLALGAMLLLSLATAALLARQLSRPVRAFALGAREIGRGGTPGRLPASGVEELHALGEAIGGMAQQLGAQREQELTLMAGISHDLRSPLARLSMGLGMLGEGDDAATRRRMELDIAEMDRLIGAQMELTRARQPEPVQAVDVCALLQEVADGAEAQLPGSVHLRLHADACRAQLPPLALHRLVANLVANAQSHGGGRLEIVCRQLRGVLCIGVRDRGPGIPADQRVAVFRPFHRLDPARQRSTGGSGLGLAIARQLADTHGWTLGLRTRGGGGSSFWLLLPGALVAARG